MIRSEIIDEYSYLQWKVPANVVCEKCHDALASRQASSVVTDGWAYKLRDIRLMYTFETDKTFHYKAQEASPPWGCD